MDLIKYVQETYIAKKDFLRSKQETPSRCTTKLLKVKRRVRSSFAAT